MRTVNFLVVASILSSMFIGMVLVSAVATAAVHAQFSSKPTSMSVFQN
jgi:hypothetical protein